MVWKRILILSVLIGFLVYLNDRLGNFFTEDFKLNDESCKVIENGGPEGPEDMVQWEHFLLISEFNLLKVFLIGGPNSAPNGSIWAYDLEHSTIYKLRIKNFPKNIDFHPHGIDIFGDELYVINHAYKRGGERIEVLRITNSEHLELVYKSSIEVPP